MLLTLKTLQQHTFKIEIDSEQTVSDFVALLITVLIISLYFLFPLFSNFLS